MYKEHVHQRHWPLYGILTVVFIIACIYFVNQTVIYERTVLTIDTIYCTCFIIIDIIEAELIDQVVNAVILFYITGVATSIVFVKQNCGAN